jgi:hypothetical protein
MSTQWSTRGGLSRRASVQVLEELVGGKLNLFVAPLCGPIVAGDQTHPVELRDCSSPVPP